MQKSQPPFKNCNLIRTNGSKAIKDLRRFMETGVFNLATNERKIERGRCLRAVCAFFSNNLWLFSDNLCNDNPDRIVN